MHVGKEPKNPSIQWWKIYFLELERGFEVRGLRRRYRKVSLIDKYVEYQKPQIDALTS